MHALKTACYEALEEGAMGLFVSVVDPRSVLEMILVIEDHPAQEDLAAMSRLFDELTDFIKRSADKNKERAEAILRARQIRGVVGI
jgi:hypothetical protein